MIDLGTIIATILNSAWLLPMLALLVVIDGPLPFLPSEPVLFIASTLAFAAGDVTGLVGLFLAALTGSLVGDALLYGLGHSSHRVLRRGRRDSGIETWVRGRVFERPVLTLAAARLLPGGRLASVTAAGRVGLPARMFLPATIASSTIWSAYMLGLGLLLGPITHGEPILSLAAGLAAAALIGSACALCRRIRPGARRPGAGAADHRSHHRPVATNGQLSAAVDRAREGCTRIGSPGILGYSGGAC